MAAHAFSQFTSRKSTVPSSKAGTRASRKRGRSSSPPPSMTERTAAWPAPGPISSFSFNRTTKVPVVKTRAAKAGVD